VVTRPYTTRILADQPRVVPTGETEHTSAARAIIAVGQMVLLCRGLGENFTHLPGGHLDPGEDPTVGFYREIAEELGRPVHSATLVAEADHRFVRERDGVLEVQHSYVYAVHLVPVVSELSTQGREPWLGFEWWAMPDLWRANLQPPGMVDLIVRYAGA
jgi:8-oxo-dGTP diphosphatase